MKRNPSSCRSCGKLYTDHVGIQGACAKLQIARKALGDILTSPFIAKNSTPWSVAKRALDETE